MIDGLNVIDRDDEFVVEYKDLATVNASRVVRKLFDAIFGPSGEEMVEQFENVIHMEMRKNEQTGRSRNKEPRGQQDSDS